MIFDIEEEVKRLNAVSRVLYGIQPENEATLTLRAMVRWHKSNEDAMLPDALLVLLVAARSCC